jgi:hypothetical protein
VILKEFCEGLEEEARDGRWFLARPADAAVRRLTGAETLPVRARAEFVVLRPRGESGRGAHPVTGLRQLAWSVVNRRASVVVPLWIAER